MKKYLIILAVFFITVSNYSQQPERFKETRNIYLFDVTLSMWGKSAGAKDIFNEVRSELIEVIKATNNPATEIVVVTFQDKIIKTWEEKATKEGKDRIIAELNKINVENVPKQNTNIYAAWKKGRELIDPNDINVVFLLTDGEHSVKHTPKKLLYQEVNDWGNFSRNTDNYAFLVELTEQAADPDLRTAVIEAHQAQIIKGIEFFIVSVENTKPVINIHDLLSFDIRLNGDRINSIPEDFTYQVTLDDPNFEIINYKMNPIQEEAIAINLKTKTSLENLKEQLPQISYLNFEITYDKQKYPQVKILNPTINCKVKNKKEMVLTLEVIEEK